MAAEVDVADANRPEDRGMNRRQMIKAAGIAGAAAWTAPMIIDSLSSPAAAFSNCHKKYIKYQPTGTCCTYDPICTTRDSDATLTCSGSGNTCSGTSLGIKAAGFSNPAGNNYYVVTLPTGCGFDPSKFTNNWAVQGNTSGTCTSVVAAASDTGSGSGNGYYVTNGQKAYLLKTKGLDYIYIQYCCST